MKKILSLFILCVLFAMNCATSISIAGFLDEEKTDGQMISAGGDSMQECHDSSIQEESGKEEKHECCTSPFQDSLNNSKVSLLEDDQDSENNDSETYSAHVNILENTLDRVNSPPIGSGKNAIFSKNSFVSLVGIIKNNN